MFLAALCYHMGMTELRPGPEITIHFFFWVQNTVYKEYSYISANSIFIATLKKDGADLSQP